jgi:hypothetical protein
MADKVIEDRTWPKADIGCIISRASPCRDVIAA